MPLWFLMLMAASSGVDSDGCAALLTADRALAQHAREAAGPAFRAVLAHESLMFTPEIRLAAPFWLEASAQPHALDWSPQVGGLAVDGKLAYTLGPYWRRDDARRSTLGHYLAIWVQETAGWRLLLDHGVLTPPAASAIASAPRCNRSATGLVDSALRVERFESLRRAEERVAEARVTTPSWLLESEQALTSEPRRCSLPMQRMRIAGSADLGFTAGAAGLRSFVRIWRYAEPVGWQIEVELCSTAQADQS